LLIQKSEIKTINFGKLTPEDAQNIAEQAFIFAAPMLENYKIMYGSVVDESSITFKAPFNVMFNEKRLYTPEDNDVSTPNSDTLYTRLWSDLRAEPIILSINPIEDRYFSFQLVDSYTNNFDYIGTRSTGDQGGDFLFAGPNWHGKIPDGIDKVFQSESDLNIFLGRTQVFDIDDLENAISIMEEDYKLQPLSEFIQEKPPKRAQEIDFIPWSDDKGFSAEFINYVNLILTWTEIHPSEKDLFKEFSKIGIKSGKKVDLEGIDPEIKNAIEAGVDSAQVKIFDNRFNLGDFENGWIKVNAYGNRDFHGDNYIRRATAGVLGIYGNSIEEAFYPTSFQDKDQTPLDASINNYVIKFSEEPPVGAFWSVTMYDVQTRSLVENTIDRWRLSGVSDLQKNEDGSFMIHLQFESPGEDIESNWLPTPNGSFYVVLRLYLTDEGFIDGTLKMPIIEISE